MKVLLICSGGMSTQILINSLEKEAKNLQINNFSANAIGLPEMDEYQNDFDIILVAPQVKYRYDQVEQFAKSKNKLIYQIQMVEYTPLGANKLLTNIKRLMEE
ncbi:PTS sugar transporter subunit IIB [Mycoplasmopsis anatis]|uniref:PTS sugar transporter subunit IIB n=1 Tax=Mycoplasmopsis anatis TaxID=171279 RepID=A0A9Q3LAR2_9BACT|nr:hypothetical protein [Mycoplasmopsis anatis]MBW0594374.1 PTS sugar transporter subunit IIB [Mycoplasmopsis anatis]MBW0595005.1 PTS sugar transporter subunit IIB [Mycoplasmopsis anatis]MBW0595776.1 PTS sugar transporter subunit IIB [Mycoplasmopsis anatis]MBW0596959.1 PTS sugar transporter subunit IIB [Mycoplasmopsis anatis]MBW0597742.1 PTS sugar transporter subunit IIB [Mycoplasmopsis anatis]